MTAGVLARLGLAFGQTVPGNQWNPKGFFENVNVRENVLKQAIVRAGGSRSGQLSMPDPHKYDGTSLRDGVLRAMNGCNAYKDAKICLIWDRWARAFPDSLYVIVRRDLDDIADSCLRTKFMQGHSTAEAWKAWAQVYVDRSERLKERVEHIEVWPDGTADVFRPVAEFAGLEWDQEAIEAFVDPSLWHTR